MLLRDRNAEGMQPAAYVRLRVVSPGAVGEFRWWSRLARELRSILYDRPFDRQRVRRALAAARVGFYPSSTAIYPIPGDRSREYVSDRQRERTWRLDWPAAGLLDDKLAFFFMLRQLGVPTPEVTGTIVSGRVHRIGHIGAPSAEWIHERLETHGRLVVRPTRGGGGTHLWVLDAHDGTFRLNGEPLAWDQIERRLSALGDHIVTDFVHQASYARRVHPDTTNTVRVLTMHDDRGPFIAAAVHRFGTPASAPADNWSKGGLSAAIDVETGTLGAAVPRPRAGIVERHDVHPATGAQISGIHVPNWEAVRDGVLRAAGLVPFLPYVGWDLIVTDAGDGFSVVEGNKYSDVNLLQVHGALMAAARVRAFFAAHGI